MPRLSNRCSTIAADRCLTSCREAAFVTPVLPRQRSGVFEVVKIEGFVEFGGEGQNRTVDTTIFSRMLYQLSYLAPGDANTRIGELVN